ncbi:DUF3108 domain-containing protein [Salinibius halmophilus]|uniref:DUF3108 domain-containing protein n=1 Tax=Salinibius halmophilus TaxID=1853216 RepID=UPI000E66E563|nr:DUF3108 domain-containing protein [Salinibius halmophilus]
MRLLGLLLVLTAHSMALAMPLSPFTLDMQAIQYGFIDVKANGQLTLQETGNQWTARLDARAAIGKQQEQAIFNWQNNQITPLRYDALTQLTFIKEEKSYQFSEQWIEGTVNGDAFRTANRNTLDPLTSMLHMGQQLRLGKTEWQQQRITWNSSKAEAYRVARAGLMNTKVGKLSVTLVEQTQGNRGNEKNYYWFANDYGYIPVRWRREVDNKITYEVLLQSGNYAGEPIVGATADQ